MNIDTHTSRSVFKRLLWPVGKLFLVAPLGGRPTEGVSEPHGGDSGAPGFTILELVIALTISSTVLLLIFLFMSNTSRGISLQNNRYKKVTEMVLSKKRIDTEIKQISRIESLTETNCRSFTISDAPLTFNFSGNKLILNNLPVCTGLKKFEFHNHELCDGRIALHWECTLLSGGWIGGSTIVNAGKM